MSRESINEYINILRKFNSGKLDGTIEERKIIQKYNDLYMNDEKWKTLIDQLKNIKSEIDQEKIVEEFLKSENLKEQENKSEEEKIAAAYGIDVSNIEKVTINNGKTIYKFYSPNINKYVLLKQDASGKSLDEQLKNIQENSVKYQQYSDQDNANAIMENQRINTNNELKLFPINEINSHPERVANLTEKEKNQLSELNSKRDELGLVSINFENCIAMTNTGKIYEAEYNTSLNRVVVTEKGATKELNTKSKEENVEKDKSGIEDLDKTMVLTEEKQKEIKAQIDPNKAQLYYDYPELMANLPEQEKELYQKNNDMINKEKEKTVEKPKIKVFKLNDNKGFTNVVLLALTTGFFGGMLTTMVIEILKIKSM